MHSKSKTQRWWVWEGGRGWVFVRWEWSLCLIDHAPETRKDKTYGSRALPHTHRPRCPGTGQRHKTSPTPSQTPALPPHRPQRALNKGLGPPSQPRPQRSGSGQRRGTGTAKGSALTWPQTAPGPGHLSVPAAGTASLPSSACPGLGARREQGRLPPESHRRGAPAALALWRLQCCSADGNSCSHQWQHKQEHFGSFSSLNCCQFWWWVVVWFCGFLFCFFFFCPDL